MADTDTTLLDAESSMDKAIEAFRQTLATIRTGRASTALVEHLAVEHYGQTMPLNQLATLATPDPQMITVQAWDKGASDAIMRAIQQSDIGITPQDDGSIIRLPIPPLTEERRRELAKQVHGKAEDARVSVRNIRRQAMDELKQVQRAGELSEDDQRRAETEVDKLTGRHTDRIEELARQKEQELLAI